MGGTNAQVKETAPSGTADIFRAFPCGMQHDGLVTPKGLHLGWAAIVRSERSTKGRGHCPSG